MCECIRCISFNIKNGECKKVGFSAKHPTISLKCSGYSYTQKWDCLKEYDNFCKHRAISDDPFSADWCKLKNTYCNNNKFVESKNEKKRKK